MVGHETSQVPLWLIFVLTPLCVPLSYQDRPQTGSIVGEGAQPSVLAFASSESFTE